MPNPKIDSLIRKAWWYGDPFVLGDLPVVVDTMDFVVYSRTISEAKANALLAAGYDKDLVQYCVFQEIPPTTFNVNSATPDSTSYAAATADESMFLHSASPATSGNRIQNVPGNNYFFMNPASPNWIAFLIDYLTTYQASSPGNVYDGWFFDNVHINASVIRGQNGGNLPIEFSSDSQYKNAVRDCLAAVRAALPGRVIGANLIGFSGTDPTIIDPLWTNLDVGMIEAFGKNYSDGSYYSASPAGSGSAYDVNLACVERGLELGKRIICVYQGINGVKFTDGVTNGTAVVTSAAAGFSGIHKGVKIHGTDVPNTNFILVVTNGTTVSMNAAASGSHSGNTFVVGIRPPDIDFAFGSFLLVCDGINAMFRFTNFGTAAYQAGPSAGPQYRYNWTFAHDNIHYGEPDGPRYWNAADSTWRRNFPAGTVIVDPVAHTARLPGSP